MTSNSFNSFLLQLNAFRPSGGDNTPTCSELHNICMTLTMEFLICSTLYTDQICISLPPGETKLSLQHQHWSADSEWFSTHRGLCNSWIDVKGFHITTLILSENESSLWPAIHSRLRFFKYKLSHLPVQNWSVINHFDLLFSQNCRANQGITCLTEAYGAWERDSLTFWRQQPTATPPNLQDKTTFYSADICNMETFHDCLQSLSMYPATVMHRRSNLVQPRWTPVPTDPCFFSGGH